MRNSLYSIIFIAFISTLAPISSVAGDFDGSKPLICAAIFSTECNAETQECVSGAPWNINFPVFSEIDFKSKTISTLDAYKNERETQIESIDHLPNGRLSLQGDDGQYAWSMLISEETGSATLSAAGEEIGFILFGACTVR